MKNELPHKLREELIEILKARFEKNVKFHEAIEWKNVEDKLRKSAAVLYSLSEMEKTGGEPDVVGFDKKIGKYIFYDCSEETPKGRRSVCYDQAALDSRKSFKPKNSAVQMATSMGIEILTEEEYQHLQQLGKFDLKTSSWLKTPISVRRLGGAIFGDCRYGRVFVYHNGADSYYAARGFRAKLKI